ncbi:hypothetical protein C1H46_005996 [Malus baccata]|uniref:Uncharacterized protein n=1 Tax=Malus baccata TaxID=106549 RepID=A0A540NBF8_MALBA|nr:hypothetical protein C1H46_005996 [Malus baccata]
MRLCSCCAAVFFSFLRSPRAERDAVRDGQVPPESESMEVLLVRMLAMVRNVAVPARGSVEKLWCDDEGIMAAVLGSFP